MSRYKELSQKAVDWTMRFNQSLEECKHFAFWMTGEYLRYMDAPSDVVKYLELDSELRGTSRTHPATSPPAMTLGKDDFWYFGLSVMFKVDSSPYFMTMRVAMGLQKGKDEWLVKWNDTNYKVPLSDLTQIRRLFDDWIAMSTSMYEGPVTRQAPSMGFVPSV
jgi:hypothetical protein